MPRTPAVPGGRTIPVCTALSRNELAALENILRGKTRSAYLRDLVLRAINEEENNDGRS